MILAYLNYRLDIISTHTTRELDLKPTAMAMTISRIVGGKKWLFFHKESKS